MSEIEKYYNGEIHIDFDDEIEELKADIEEYRDSTTWWSNRFKAVERDNRKLKKEIERLNNVIKQIYEIFEKGRFEDNCDCIQIEELITRELKGEDKE